ncbi:MAG: STAS domain-containing protein [Planctomycetota bacterium]
MTPAIVHTDVERVPLQVVRGCVIASVQIELGDEILRVFQQDLLEELRRTRARAVILDLSGVEILDTSDYRSIHRTLRMSRLMGAEPIIVGLRAGIAASLAELGAELDEVRAFGSLAQAIDLVDRRAETRG